MPTYCAAYRCSEGFKKGGQYTFHSFPKDEERRKKWVIALRRENFQPSNSSKICSKHFHDECFDREKFGGTWLKSDAIPTLFDFPSHLQKAPITRKPPTKRSFADEAPDQREDSLSSSCTMPSCCAAYGCSQKYKKGGQYTLHSFPKDEERRKLWVNALRREYFQPSIYSKICSKHFLDECFNRNKLGGTWLKSDAVPTIFDFPAPLLKTDLASPTKCNTRKPPSRSRRKPTSSANDATNKREVALLLCDTSQSMNKTPKKRLKVNRYPDDCIETDFASPAKCNTRKPPSKRSQSISSTDEAADKKEVSLSCDMSHSMVETTKKPQMVFIYPVNCNATDLPSPTKCNPLKPPSKKPQSISSTDEAADKKEVSLSCDMSHSMIETTKKPQMVFIYPVNCNATDLPSPTKCNPQKPPSKKPQSISSTDEAADKKEVSLLACDVGLSLSAEETTKLQKLYRYPGDFKETDLSSPTKCKAALDLAKTFIQRKNQQIKSLKQKKRRMENNVVSLESMVNHLQKISLISETAKDTLLIALPESAKKKKCAKFQPELRSFALTLHFYSSEAYDYVRKTFKSALPPVTTLRKWYQSVKGKPGFTMEALSALKSKVINAAAVNKKIYCSLLMSVVDIRNHVEWDGTKLSGYIDFGSELADDDQLPLATEALVIMVNAVNDHWKVPIGYFFTNGLNGCERANLVNESLTLLYEIGVEVVSITCDGTSSNINMATKLGANMDFFSLNTKFKHPVSESDVYILLDACHMLKLIRNALVSNGCLVDQNMNIIKWDYIVRLERYLGEQGPLAAMKLKKLHVQFASQIFSSSVADALEFLDKGLKIKEFQGCQATVNFIRRINNLYNIFNSRNILSKGFKSPMKHCKERFVMNYLLESKVYLKEISSGLNGLPILKTNRKTGFLGFLVCINSIIGIYEKLVKGNNAPLKFILTHKLSQDHLEIFVSAIRYKVGHSNNPTAKQFEEVYKRLIVHNEIITSNAANSLVLNCTSILNVSSGKPDPFIIKINSLNNLALYAESETTNATSYCFMQPKFSTYTGTDDIVAYTAEFVRKKLLKSINCSECVAAIHENGPLSNSNNNQKNSKGLKVASKDVIKICKAAESCFRVAKSSGRIRGNNSLSYLITSSFRNINYDIFSSLSDHILDQEPLDDHRFALIKSVLFQYLSIRLHHEKKCICLTQDFHDCRIRSNNKKIILFKGH